MTDFSRQIKSKAKLTKGVASLKDAQLYTIISHLESIMTDREESRAKQKRADAAKNIQIDDFKAQMKAAGISISDLGPKPKR